jgi:hypothetical protein
MPSPLKSCLFVFTSILLGLVFSANQRAQAQTTIGSCSSANAIDASTGDNAFVVGQVFTVPPGDIALKNFTFYVSSPGAAPVSFRFYVYAWKGFVAQGVIVEGLALQGTALFRSAPVTVSSADYQAVTIDTNELPVTPGARYMIIASNWEFPLPFPALGIKACDLSTDYYDAGFSPDFTTTADAFPNIETWTGGNWSVNLETPGAANSDFSFSASFISIQQVIDDLQNQINTLTGENQTLQNQVNDLTGQVQSLQTQVNTLTAQVQTLTQQKQTLQNQLNGANQTINTLNSQLAQLQAQLAQSQAAVAAFLNSIELDLRRTFKDPRFTIPGANPQQRLQNLLNALLNLNKGHKEGLYQALRGKR